MRLSDQVAANKAAYFSRSCIMTRKRRTPLILAWHWFHGLHRGYKKTRGICDSCKCHEESGSCFSCHICDNRKKSVIQIATVYVTWQKRWTMTYKTNYHSMQILTFLICQRQTCYCNHALFLSIMSVSVHVRICKDMNGTFDVSPIFLPCDVGCNKLSYCVITTYACYCNWDLFEN